MDAPTPVEFWFEFGSTYSYPAAMRIEDAAASAGVPLRWRPFLLGPIFKAQGWNDSPFNIYEAKGRYMWRDLARICARQQLRLTPPSRFPRNGLLAARVACYGDEAPWLPAFVRAVYTANFADDREISEPSVLADVLRDLGLDPASTLAAAQEAPVKERLRAWTDEAIARGLFGAPSFLVGDELFWGNDRVEDALAWATRQGLPAAG